MLQRITKVVLLFCTGAWFSGCNPATPSKPLSSSVISGVYVLAYQGMIDELNLHSGESFRQTITYTDGKKYPFIGTWKFDGANTAILDGNYRRSTGSFGKLYHPAKPYPDGGPERATALLRIIRLRDGLALVVNEENDLYYYKK